MAEFVGTSIPNVPPCSESDTTGGFAVSTGNASHLSANTDGCWKLSANTMVGNLQ